MFGLVLAIGIALSGGDPVEAAKKATLNGDYERSAILLESVKPTALNWNDYYYYSLINHFKLNQKEKALQDIKMVEMTFVKYTRRQDCLIYMMTEDLKHWKEGDLGDIGRDMGMSSDRLRIAKGGKDTQKVQKDIVDKLDRLIKQQEDKANGGGGDGQANKGEDKDGGASKSNSSSSWMKTCYDCEGHGTIVTPYGEQVLDFIRRRLVINSSVK
jgi:hypothetical protein